MDAALGGSSRHVVHPHTARLPTSVDMYMSTTCTVFVPTLGLAAHIQRTSNPHHAVVLRAYSAAAGGGARLPVGGGARCVTASVGSANLNSCTTPQLCYRSGVHSHTMRCQQTPATNLWHQRRRRVPETPTQHQRHVQPLRIVLCGSLSELSSPAARRTIRARGTRRAVSLPAYRCTRAPPRPRPASAHSLARTSSAFPNAYSWKDGTL